MVYSLLEVCSYVLIQVSLCIYSVPQFHINSSTSTSITVQFPYNYYTGPPPHGHEVVVENKDLNSVLSYSRYFQISILHAVISDLSPNTEYVLHIRANGSHHTGNYGRWKSVEVKTQPVGKYTCNLYKGGKTCS